MNAKLNDNFYERCSPSREYQCGCERRLWVETIVRNWKAKPRLMRRYEYIPAPYFAIKWEQPVKFGPFGEVGSTEEYTELYFLFCPFCGKETKEIKGE